MQSNKGISRKYLRWCSILVLSAVCVAQTPAPAEPEEKAKVKPWLDIYGFAMMDTGYDFKQVDPNWFDVVRVTKLPAYKDQFGSDGNTFFSVRQTRFGAKSEAPTKLGTLKTWFEFELFGTGVDAGQTTFRLRHAYGEIGHFGAGQTNSVFMDGDVFPNTVEYWGPTGMVLFRNVQVRWMPVMGESRIILAVERPGASADQGVYADRIELQGVKAHFPAPDITGQARLGRKWGHIQAAGLVRRIEWKDTGNTQYDLSGDAWGWGINLTGNLKVPQKKDVFKWSVVYGKGIQNYMNDAPADIGIQNQFSNTKTPITGVPLPLLGIVAYYDHYWNEKLSSSFGYSRLDIDNSDGQAADAFKTGQYANANLLFYPVKDFMAGGEFVYGYRKNFKDGFSVPDYRIQFSFKYDFSFRVFGK
jgi:hypothetical protein